MNDSNDPLDVEVRLHFGNESIDSTHTMTRAAYASLMTTKYADTDETQFLSDFEDWVNALTGHSAEKALRDEFALAAWDGA